MLLEFNCSLVYNVIVPSTADYDLRTLAIEMLNCTNQNLLKGKHDHLAYMPENVS
jgi:hypothetical protein